MDNIDGNGGQEGDDSHRKKTLMASKHSWSEYMSHKRDKQWKQLNERKECLNSSQKQLFSGICVFVNGVTNPSELVLKQLVVNSGGMCVNHFDAKRVTHIIASNMAFVKMKNLKDSCVVVKPDWICDSLTANQLLSIDDYLVVKRTNDNIKRFFVNRDNKESTKEGSDERHDSVMTTLCVEERVDSNENKSLSEMRSKETKQKQKRKVKSDSKALKRCSFGPLDLLFNDIKSQKRGGLLTSDSTPNICGKSVVKDVIELLEEWVNTEEELMDEDVAYVTKYMCDLIDQKKFNQLEVVFKQLFVYISNRNIEWKLCFNDLRKTLLNELKVQRIDCEMHFKSLLSTDYCFD